MKHVLTALILGLIIVSPGLMIHHTVADQHQVQVVGTITFLTDYAKELLGTTGTYHSIIKANQDPHFVEPSAEDLNRLESSDIILAIGNDEIDGWLLQFIKDNKDMAPKVVYVIDQQTALIEDPLIHALNPHFWMSPANAKIMVNNIAQAFIERNIQPNLVRTNLPIYLNKLDKLISDISTLASTLNSTKVVEDHPAFFYLSMMLNLTRVGTLEEHEGIDPSPLHVQQLSDLMKSENVKLILASKIQAGSDVQELARMTGAKVAYLYVLPGNPDAETYLSMIYYDLNIIQNPESIAPANSAPIPFIPIFLSLILMVFISRRRKIRIFS